MNREHCYEHYTTHSVIDTKEGYAALELHRTANGSAKRVARVVFWDAAGQLYFETFNADIPVTIAEELIAEAKQTINK